ncbi:YpmS family protein [Streptococcus saliviloxodontae]|uniref:Uncharacterized protein YpmS n=1 Tax=Streptococcus saliviloxodontae TaxID=1349416 RepID=A0ABS2PP11_9STRE|nr:YpmS family protein [Streptococcus saliviloxodontae]MBM7636696.1 uncharacterized protein YpmS [Streptococcus saliviloxodontae]
MKQNKNGNLIWKWAFLILLALNLSLVAVVTVKVMLPRESLQTSNPKQSSIEVGSFETTREHVNQTVASYLKAYQTDQLSYSFTATATNIVFGGSYRLLGYDVPLHLNMTPMVLKNGDIRLRVTSVSVGSLGLPKKQVLRYLTSSYKLPSFVVIDSKKAVITLDLDKISDQSDIYLKANQIDLSGNHLKFTIYKKNPSN